jgi:flagellin
MAVINTNVKALFSQSALKRTEGAQANAMAQLSTGKRINTAADDAAGLAISTRMTHQIRSLNQAIRNAGDAISLIQTAEGATNEITDMMQRMRELAVQAVNDTNDNAQRSYLDLEFQQLKAEIVHISESTEWNGFPLLNGTAGERVGEMPLYKATSASQLSEVFVNPTTMRTVSGNDSGIIPGAGEAQTIDFTPDNLVPTTGVIKVGGVSVTITEADIQGANDAAKLNSFTAAIKTALEANTNFDPTTSGRLITQTADGQLTIAFAGSEGDVDDIVVDVGATGVQKVVTVSRHAVGVAEEDFVGNGAFLKSGTLSMSVDSTGVVTAAFLGTDNQSYTLTGVASLTDGTVTFTSTTGHNSKIISGDLVYSLKRSIASGSDTIDLTGRQVGVSVSVEGGVPAFRAGDLRINGIDIGASYASDDSLSPASNSAGSAIAKAAAINRMASTRGADVGESQTLTFTGVPQVGTIVVGGVSVQLTGAETTSALATAKIASTLRASTLFGQNSGRVVTYAPGGSTLKIDFPTSERDVPSTSVLPGTTGLSPIVDVNQEYATFSAGTGVYAKVNENVFNGQSMTSDASVSGVVWVNGYASGDITTSLNNTRATRSDVVKAINAITAKTGVKAIDTGYDSKGVTLVAADGRNIEVSFVTDSSASLFGKSVGLREGVHTGTYSLESKIEAPVVISSATTGDITRTGLIEGNFSKNQAVFNTSTREIVDAPVAQTEAVAIGVDAGGDNSYSVTINGTTFTSTSTSRALIGTDAIAVRQDLYAQIYAESSTLGVNVDYGRGVTELLLSASTAGTPFTLSTSDSGTNDISLNTVAKNKPADSKPLSVDDLMINGVKIRATSAADDTKSSALIASSDRSASAIALAAAINASSSETGVRALANPVISKGLSTVTSVPTTTAGGTTYNLFVNGTTVPVVFAQNETLTARREKVVEAINARTGQHGVTAADNGNGVTLQSDGRNMSIWFDSNQKDVSAASFGLDKGGSVAQVSRIAISGSVNGENVYVSINGEEIGPVAAGDSASLATLLESAINEKITSGDLKNISVTNNGSYLDITSTIPGSPFTLNGAKASSLGPTLTLSTVTTNSFGKNDITGIPDATATSTSARTVYSTVRMISDPALLPKLPSPYGAPPSDQLDKLRATGEPFKISVGDNGFSSGGNFLALGFEEGMFGGRSSEEMDPPRVGRLAFQVGSSANQYITIDLADFGKKGAITGDITGDVDLNVENRRVRINTRDGASAVLTLLDDAMDKVNATRATMGAVMNRMQHVISNLSNVTTNLSASRSQIEDADYAAASTELAKTQIMQQAATAVLAQANTSQQTVLKLLQG